MFKNMIFALTVFTGLEYGLAAVYMSFTGHPDFYNALIVCLLFLIVSND